MSNILSIHQAVGTISIAVNNVDHSCTVDEDGAFTTLLSRAIRRGHDAATTFRFIATLGAQLWHPNDCVDPDLLLRYEDYFGGPGSIPNGSILGSVVLHVNGKKSVADIRGGSKYDIELLRAHLRGKNAAEAFMFLAEVGAKTYHPTHSMLKSGAQAEAKKLFLKT